MSELKNRPVKVLRAFGAPQDGRDFNWCNPAEIVGIHGMVCCHSEGCGCDRSFVGLKSYKATTRGQVCEVTREVFAEALGLAYLSGAKGWSSHSLGLEFIKALFDLSAWLEQYPVGTMLRVKKSDDDWELLT